MSYYPYHAVPGNLDRLRVFGQRLRRIWRLVLSRPYRDKRHCKGLTGLLIAGRRLAGKQLGHDKMALGGSGRHRVRGKDCVPLNFVKPIESFRLNSFLPERADTGCSGWHG
jgi:hypothetical protein